MVKKNSLSFFPPVGTKNNIKIVFTAVKKINEKALFFIFLKIFFIFLKIFFIKTNANVCLKKKSKT